MIIAVDGPAGAGKSTVAKLLAVRLGFLYIDTGAMYRALTLAVLKEGIDPSDRETVTALASKVVIDLIPTQKGPVQVLLDGKDVSLDIRTPQITRYVSDIAKIKEVRSIMLRLQRRLGAQGDCIMDGRDIGTVVFPAADVKFFIDASFEERVTRRHKDLLNMDIRGVNREQVARDLSNRDSIDSTREVAPLRKADDAVCIDTTAMSIAEVVDAMVSRVAQQQKKHG